MFKNLALPRIQFGGGQESQVSPVVTYYLILVPALLLGAFGLVMGFSATSVNYISQGINPVGPFLRTLLIAVVALGAAALAARFSPLVIRRLSFVFYLGALGLQLLLIPFGVGQGGNTNWLQIPGTTQTIQPSELLKLATVLLLANCLSNPKINLSNWKQVALYAGAPALAALAAVMVGQDMGTALIFVALTLGTLFIAGVPLRWFGAILLVGLGAAAFFISVNPSRLRRVLEVLPGFGTEPSTSAPTQTDHALWALGSGGLAGVGAGASREKWNYLQEAHTDFILAIVGEEFGFIGTITLLVVLAILIFGVLQLSSNSEDPFVRTASGGIAAWIIAQGLINIGMVVGLTPVIGVPFPLVSYGGSSFLFTALAIGVLLSFARQEAGMAKASKLNVETAGRDPRRSKPRKVSPPARARETTTVKKPAASSAAPIFSPKSATEIPRPRLLLPSSQRAASPQVGRAGRNQSSMEAS